MIDPLLLLARVTETRTEGAWCTLEKCQMLAALVLANRPRLVVEIGVWNGDSLVPMLLALQHAGGDGKAIAIDPWSPIASVEGQNETNAGWWGSVNHDDAMATFQGRLANLGLDPICGIIRRPSDEVDPPTLGEIDLLHIDGNHGEQAFRDVVRFTRMMPIGSVLVMDDVGWEGGRVMAARDRAIDLGFVERYQLGSGCVMFRTARPAL